MAKYRRARREDFEKSTIEVLSINLGSVDDSFEDLQQMCKDKSNELIKTLTLEDGKDFKDLVVAFWTKDFPELIGVSKITKNEHGLLTYSIDFSESTL